MILSLIGRFALRIEPFLFWEPFIRINCAQGFVNDLNQPFIQLTQPSGMGTQGERRSGASQNIKAWTFIQAKACCMAVRK